MAKRDTVVLAGDFNAEVQHTPRFIGQSLNKSEYHSALDPHSLTRFVQANELVVLNTWHMKDPCVNYTRTGNSQIDFVMVRQASADRQAKKVEKREAPFGAWKEMTHHALTANLHIIRHFHLPQATEKKAPPCSVKDLDHAYRTKDPRILELQKQVQQTLANNQQHEAEAVNSAMLQAVSKLFPAHSTGRTGQRLHKEQRRAIFSAWRELITHPDGEGGSTPAMPAQVYHMWQRRKDLKRCKPYTAAGVMRAWKWIILFLRAGRLSKQYHQQHQRYLRIQMRWIPLLDEGSPLLHTCLTDGRYGTSE